MLVPISNLYNHQNGNTDVDDDFVVGLERAFNTLINILRIVKQ